MRAFRNHLAHDLRRAARLGIGWALLAFVFSACAASVRPPADASRSPHSAPEPERPLATGTTGAEPPAKNAPQVCPAEPDGDADGIPDRCDACPLEPGMIWDDFPGIDGCSTAVFHGLVREPEGTILRIGYEPNSHEPPSAGLDELIRVLQDTSIDSIALVGYAARSERDPGALARKRARRMADVLVARGVRARRVTYTSTTDASAIDVAVLARNGQEELRWMGDRFEHVRAAAARAARERAQRQPSPCGRMPGTRSLPPPPCP